MLISKTVEVKWSHRNKGYYQSKGYNFSKYNDIFTVNIEDLSIGCSSNVKVKCDYCNEEYEITYHKYNNLYKSNTNKDACNNCRNLKVSEIARNKSKNKIKPLINTFINDINIIKVINIDDTTKHGVYIVMNIYNNKYYIGSTINLYARMVNHLKELRENKYHSIHLQRSWNKYGESNFIFGILEYIDNVDILVEREQYWLDKLKAYDDKYGYNICKKAYSCLGVKHGERSQEVKDKISKANKGRERRDVWGSKNSSTILTEEIVEEIKLQIYNGKFVQEIYKDFNVSASIIYDIINKVTWKHVLPDLDLSNCKNFIPHAKLTKKEVLEIRKKLLNGADVNDLSEEYYISVATIRDIKAYRTWKNIHLLEVG